MSSQNAGRQSPPPERQSGIQQQDPPSSGKIGASSSQPAPEFAQQESDRSKSETLTSNPEHPLEKIEAAKYKKGPGN
ncbi:uncharacterized protein N7484_008397 [Penicillium longicatenatum]|uniref:uncharacterized protein n=1 Tax=Penicillium longicatenatum TaxID=1561947 RepID=UPI002547C10E|nr:uncharacterized protein N7484_008397 [Penicillium longicatenatum]KAJ5635084.1 hypothetical protein N7484_008397 [Penicillium longicatenatum]